MHALRLIGSGVFDECPKLKLVLGHIGEGIPVYLWRIDNRNGWMKARHKYPAKHGVAHYFRKHFLHDVGQLRHARTRQCDNRDGRGPRDVFGRLAV